MSQSDLDSSQHNAEAIRTVLNGLDALVYVADMETHELIFFNDYGVERWGKPASRKCWQTLQNGQTGPCDFCTNHLLVDAAGNPTGVHVWEFQNTANGRWYQCRDQAIRWVDGRLVRMEIATDITDRKQLEQELEKAREEAQTLAETDPLTGIRNRRAFFAFGKQAISQSRRAGHPVSLVMFDLDYFKRINDQFGHAAGDEILIQTSRIVSEATRESDIFARLGGEEFVILLPETGTDKALQFAQRLREAMKSLSVDQQGQQIAVTASFGLSSCLPDETPQHCLADLLSQADKALYKAKTSGRDRICTLQESTTP